jgi:hypothetical protein
VVGQRIHVARAPAAVMVSGLVEGADRQDLVSRLRAMPNSAALRVDLETPEELATATTAGARGPTHLTFRLVDLQRDAIPAADHVRRSTSPQEIWRLPFENTERGRARSFFNDR